jgi:hypothetical protein
MGAVCIALRGVPLVMQRDETDAPGGTPGLDVAVPATDTPPANANAHRAVQSPG